MKSTIASQKTYHNIEIPNIQEIKIIYKEDLLDKRYIMLMYILSKLNRFGFGHGSRRGHRLSS